MKKLTSCGDPNSLSPEEIVDTLLVDSGVAGHLPTDENLLLDYLGLRQLSFDFMNELDFIESNSSSPTNLRAALSLNDRLVAVQSGLGQKRGRFSILHEIGHFVLPEHRDRLFLDTDETLSWWTKLRLEREANKMAADLLFQGQRFTDEALDLPIAIQSILDLAPKYAASYEAALRRLVERHVLPCAVIVYDKVAKTTETDFEDDRFRIQYTVASELFRKRFFSGVHTKEESFPGEELYNPRRRGDIVKEHLTVDTWRFDTEMFSNGYKIFQLIVRVLDE
jgi:Zn-dependent peptidase ImmA (M78 family)